jgi:hypothetical protein
MTTNLILILLLFVIAGIFFFYIGVHIQDLNKKLDDLLRRTVEKEPEPVITMGAYEPETGLSTDNSPTGLVTAKSPQLVEWEEQEAVRKMNLRPQ